MHDIILFVRIFQCRYCMDLVHGDQTDNLLFLMINCHHGLRSLQIELIPMHVHMYTITQILLQGDPCGGGVYLVVT